MGKAILMLQPGQFQASSSGDSGGGEQRTQVTSKFHCKTRTWTTMEEKEKPQVNQPIEEVVDLGLGKFQIKVGG